MYNGVKKVIASGMNVQGVDNGKMIKKRLNGTTAVEGGEGEHTDGLEEWKLYSCSSSTLHSSTLL